jgi:hypothetical protein
MWACLCGLIIISNSHLSDKTPSRNNEQWALNTWATINYNRLAWTPREEGATLVAAQSTSLPGYVEFLYSKYR